MTVISNNYVTYSILYCTEISSSREISCFFFQFSLMIILGPLAKCSLTHCQHITWISSCPIANRVFVPLWNPLSQSYCLDYSRNCCYIHSYWNGPLNSAYCIQELAYFKAPKSSTSFQRKQHGQVLHSTSPPLPGTNYNLYRLVTFPLTWWNRVTKET